MGGMVCPAGPRGGDVDRGEPQRRSGQGAASHAGWRVLLWTSGAGRLLTDTSGELLDLLVTRLSVLQAVSNLGDCVDDG